MSGGGMGGVSSTGYGQPSAAPVANQTMAPVTNNVADLYHNILNRDPDQAGLDYWNSQANSGMSMNDIRNSFLNSQEFSDNPAAQQHYLQYMQSIDHPAPQAPIPQSPIPQPIQTQATTQQPAVAPYVPTAATPEAQPQAPTFNAPTVTQSGSNTGAVNYQYKRGGIAELLGR